MGEQHPDEELTDREIAERGWRKERFEALGLDSFRAAELAVAGADWHDAKAMLDEGATVDDVYAILL